MRIRSPIAVSLGVLLSVAAISGCHPDRVSGVNPAGLDERASKELKYGVAISPDIASMKPGATLQLSVLVATEKKNPKDLDLNWTTSDPTIANVSATGLVTALSVGGPITITAYSASKKIEPATAQITVAFPIPTWTPLVSRGDAPTGAAFRATDAAGENSIYSIIGGGDFQPFELWRFDLTNDSWTLIPTVNFPVGKFRNIVHDPLTHTILTYWDGLGQVFSVSEDGGAWGPIGIAGNQDSYYEAAAFWNTMTGRLTVFGGYGGFVWKNTIWSFDPRNPGWSLENQSADRPWPRFGVAQAMDESSNHFYAYGGQGYPTGNQSEGTYVLDDLWRLDLRTNSWTLLISYSQAALPTVAPGMDFVPAERAIYRFGGMAGVNANAILNTLERADLGASNPTWQIVAADGVAPSARWGAAVFYDPPRHRLVVIGGNITGQATALDAYELSLP